MRRMRTCGSILRLFYSIRTILLYPRPIEQIIHDLNLFDNFEKILCYQFPGVFNDPEMSIRVGEARTINLFNGYMRYLKELKYRNKTRK